VLELFGGGKPDADERSEVQAHSSRRRRKIGLATAKLLKALGYKKTLNPC
jgi:hypothetical protein